jgi:hypothetical protein
MNEMDDSVENPLAPVAGWDEKLDPSSGKTYYYNRATKETSWNNPNASPAVSWQRRTTSTPNATWT